MKTIVIYQSSTGFTQQYAKWIAEELQCEAVSVKEMPVKDINNYDCVVYGGWIMANMVAGLRKIQKLNPKKLVVFGVGASEPEEEMVNAIKEANAIKDIPFFYFQGGFRFEKLSFFKRMMLNMLKKSLAKKENPTEKEKAMAQMLGTSFDASDKAQIESLVAYMNK